MTGDTVHGTCVAFGGHAVLLRGAPGAGKSDLALRLIDGGATLVADDRVRLVRDGDLVVAAPPGALAGMLEIRGIGLFELPHAGPLPLRLIADLVAPDVPERLPEPASCEYLGCRIRRVAVAPFEASALAKLRIAAYAAAGERDPATDAAPHCGDED